MKKWLFCLVFIFSAPALYSQRAENLEEFDYNGDLFLRGFYLGSDLPRERQTQRVCPDPITQAEERAQAEADRAAGNDVTYSDPSKCKEETDFYTIRFRLNMSLRPSEYVDIMYGLEVGDITFGESTSDTGPGTGGQGSGAANLETRELRVNIHNRAKTVAFQAGVFPFSTPSGLVVANSGAGFQFSYDTQFLRSEFDLYYFRKEDQSRNDIDSNGFNDENYKDVHLGLFTWKFSGLTWLRSEAYGVYRADRVEFDENNNYKDTSQLYWGGLFLQFRFGRFNMMIHGVGNWGEVYTMNRELPRIDLLEISNPELVTLFENAQDNAELTGTRQAHEINAGAGEASITYQFTNRLEFGAVATGASGRRGLEPDGTSSDYRPDQWRDAGRAYQFSEIAIDSNGGYSLFELGDLTGLVAKGIKGTYQLTQTVEMELAYYTIETFRTPVIDYNQFFTRLQHGKSPSSYIGEEVNLIMNWRPAADLTISIRGSYFDAGDGYKILNDVEYGDDAGEFQVSLLQRF